MNLSILPQEPISIRIYDRTFDHETEKNPYINFIRCGQEAPLTLFTDLELEKAPLGEEYSVAWLIESPAVNKRAYRKIKRLEDRFDRILTFYEPLLKRSSKYVFCPFGTTFIAEEDRGIHSKTHRLSIVASDKRYLKGHKMRHDVVKAFHTQIDRVAGKGYDFLANKADALRDYQYSIAIENERADYYFTEKIIDCFLTGTVPIYWGCPSINRFFDPQGIITFKSIRELKKIIPVLSSKDYEKRLPAIRKNFELAQAYIFKERSVYNALIGMPQIIKPLV